MKGSLSVLRVVLVAAMLSFSALATEPGTATRIGNSCDLSLFGAANSQDFVKFDHEFRAGLAAEDPKILAMLASYPIRVNDRFGARSVLDSKSLAGQLKTIFPPSIRSAVAKQSLQDLFCNSEGITYGNGVVWIQAKELQGRTGHPQFLIRSINLPNGEERPAAPSVQMVCRTKDHRVLIDTDEQGRPRYTVWDMGSSILDKPTMQIPNGTKYGEGSNVCAHSVWTFKQGRFTYKVEEGGCANAPDSSLGSLVMLEDAHVKAHEACF